MSSTRIAATVATLLALTLATPITAANAATPSTSAVHTATTSSAVEHTRAVARYKAFLEKYYGYHLALVQEKGLSYRTVIAFTAKGKIVAHMDAANLTSKEIKDFAAEKRYNVAAIESIPKSLGIFAVGILVPLALIAI
jgi:hypothetical protein